MSALESPTVVSIDSTSGVGLTFAEHYAKRFADVVDIYADRAAADRIGPDSIAYEVYSNERTAESGALVFGTSVLMPGKVGDEYTMTRGHQHQIADRAEMYYCLAGAGVLLMEDTAGQTVASPMTPGDVVYVPGGWIHRSVNVGSEPLVTLFCFSADAGQDYSVIDRANGMAMLVVTDGADGWALRKNKAYRPRTMPSPTPAEE